MGKKKKAAAPMPWVPPVRNHLVSPCWTRTRADEEREIIEWRSEEVKKLGLFDDTFNPPPGQPSNRGKAREELLDAIDWASEVARAGQEHKIFDGCDTDNMGRCLRYHGQWMHDHPDATTGDTRDHRSELLQFVNPICRKVYEATKATAAALTTATGKAHSTVAFDLAFSGHDFRESFDCFPRRAIEWMVHSAREVPLKKGLHETCETARRFLEDAQCRKHFEGDDEDQLAMAVQAVDRWWIDSEAAGNDAVEAKLLELEGVVLPIMSRVRISGGGWLFAAPAQSPSELGSEPSGACSTPACMQ